MDGLKKMNADEGSAESVLRDSGRPASSRALCQSFERLLPFKLHLPVALPTLNERRKCVLCFYLKETSGLRRDAPKSGICCKCRPDGVFLCVYGTENALRYFLQFQIYPFLLIKIVYIINFRH